MFRRPTRTTCGRSVRAALLSLLLLPCFSGVARGQATAVNEEAHNQFVLAYRLLQRGQKKDATEAFDAFLGNFPSDEKRADALYCRALLARDASQHQYALRLLTAAGPTRIVPDHAVKLLRGQLHTELGQYDRALQVLESLDAQKLEPLLQASALHLRGMAYRGAGNLPAAAAQFEAAAGVDSSLRPRALLDQARMLGQLDRQDEALAVLGHALTAQDPQVSPQAARLAGDLAYGSERFEEALRFYNVVLERYQSSPHFGAAVRGALWSCFSSKQYGQLLRLFEGCRGTIRQVSDRLEAFYLAGSAQQELGRHDQAVNLLQSLFSDASSWPLLDKLLYKHAVSLFELGRFDDMERSLRRLEANRPKSPLTGDCMYLRAAADARRGNTERAAARLTAVIDRGPEHPNHGQALLQRAQLHEASGRYEPAIADYETFRRSARPDQGPHADQISLRLVDLYYRNADYEKSKQAALALLGPADAGAARQPMLEQEALYRLALAHIKLGENEPAIATFDRLARHHPENRYRHEASYYRALALMVVDRTDEALKALEQVGASQNIDEALRTLAIRLAALMQRQRQDHEAAAASLARLEAHVGASGLTAEERLWIARWHVNGQRHTEALGYLEPLLTKGAHSNRRDHAETLYLAGRCRRAAGFHDKAIEDFEQVVTIGAGFALRARLELGRTLAESGRLPEALASYAGLINVKPTRIAVEALLGRARAFRALAEARHRQSDAAGAEKALRDARGSLHRLLLLHAHPELSPLPQRAHVELHAVLAELGDGESIRNESHLNLTELLERYADSPFADYARAILALSQYNQADAVLLLKRLESQAADPLLTEHVQAQLRALMSES